MTSPRFRFNMAALDGKLYVVGGIPANTAMEIYDPETQKWTQGKN